MRGQELPSNFLGTEVPMGAPCEMRILIIEDHPDHAMAMQKKFNF